MLASEGTVSRIQMAQLWRLGRVRTMGWKQILALPRGERRPGQEGARPRHPVAGRACAPTRSGAPMACRMAQTWAGVWSECVSGARCRFSEPAAGQLAAGTCEIVTLDRDSSQPRRTIARQTARCACRKGQIAGTTRARPACVDARIIRTKQWCDMLPCLEGEGCDLLINRSGWTCTQPGGRIKTTTVS
uniref:TAFA chemokine like family member 5 n=1 Tax=Sus scrofa TaxID=9823 RepID=A0A8D0NB06_PIG